MTTTPDRGAAAPARGRRPALRPTAAVVIVSTVLGVATTSPSLVRIALALAASALIVIVSFMSPRQAVTGLVVWLAGFGTLRRILLMLGAGGENDPLLLVAPVAVTVLVVVAAQRGAFRQRTPLTTSVLVLSALIAASALNPLQGGLSVGLAALMFVLVPTLWFWVGRAIVGDDLFRRVLHLIAMLAPAAALYGLYQVYRGFPPWDESWIQSRDYASLQVGEALRQFSSFASTAEYVLFLAIGAVIWALHLNKPIRALPAAAALGILGWALAVASVRGILVLLPIALAAVVAVSRGLGLAKTALMGGASLLLVSVAVSTLNPDSFEDDRTSDLLGRQVSGLADPFNPEVSTLPLHLEAIVDGLRQVVAEPLGRGPGSITLAGVRLGSGAASTEADPSNMAVALGVPGLLAYLSVVGLGLRLAFRRARDSRDVLSLASLGILLVTSLQWLTGGNYAVAPLPWLVLGWLDRPGADTDV